ncbi:MAG: hypothetical protein AB1551_01195 [Actinomycetota bacterium]
MRRTILLLAAGALVMSACSGGSEEGQGTQTTTPEASAETYWPETGSWESGGFTVEDLVETWIGEGVEPARNTTYSYRVTIRQCDPGESCGDLRIATRNFAGTGKPLSCKGTLTYLGTQDHAFVFQEDIDSGICANALLALMPMPSGLTLGVEEYWEGGWGSHGVLRMSAYA